MLAIANRQFVHRDHEQHIVGEMRVDATDRLVQQVVRSPRRHPDLDADRATGHLDVLEQGPELGGGLSRKAPVAAELGDRSEQELVDRLNALEVDLDGVEALAGLVAEHIQPDCLAHPPRVVDAEVVVGEQLVARSRCDRLATDGVAGIDRRSGLRAKRFQHHAAALYGNIAVELYGIGPVHSFEPLAPGYGRRSRSRRNSAVALMPPLTWMRANAYGSAVGLAKPRLTVVAAR